MNCKLFVHSLNILVMNMYYDKLGRRIILLHIKILILFETNTMLFILFN